MTPHQAGIDETGFVFSLGSQVLGPRDQREVCQARKPSQNRQWQTDVAVLNMLSSE